jgi:hypothetical protein
MKIYVQVKAFVSCGGPNKNSLPCKTNCLLSHLMLQFRSYSQNNSLMGFQRGSNPGLLIKFKVHSNDGQTNAQQIDVAVLLYDTIMHISNNCIHGSQLHSSALSSTILVASDTDDVFRYLSVWPYPK